MVHFVSVYWSDKRSVEIEPSLQYLSYLRQGLVLNEIEVLHLTPHLLPPLRHCLDYQYTVLLC